MATYRDLAEKDMEAALILYSVDLKSYNTCAIHCRQCAEKYLKNLLARIYVKIADRISREEFSEAMGSHSLKRLLYFCEKGTNKLSTIREEIVTLNDYYTNVSYPGETYIEVNKNEAKELIRCATIVREVCITILEGRVV